MRCCRLRFPLHPANGEVFVCDVCAAICRWNEAAQEWILDVDIEEEWVEEFYLTWGDDVKC